MDIRVEFTVKYKVDGKYKIAEISCWIEADKSDALPDLLIDEDVTVFGHSLSKYWGTWIEGYRNLDYIFRTSIKTSWECFEKMTDLLIQFEFLKLEEVYKRNLGVLKTKPLDIFQGDAYSYILSEKE